MEMSVTNIVSGEMFQIDRYRPTENHENLSPKKLNQKQYIHRNNAYRKPVTQWLTQEFGLSGEALKLFNTVNNAREEVLSQMPTRPKPVKVEGYKQEFEFGIKAEDYIGNYNLQQCKELRKALGNELDMLNGYELPTRREEIERLEEAALVLGAQKDYEGKFDPKHQNPTDLDKKVSLLEFEALRAIGVDLVLGKPDKDDKKSKNVEKTEEGKSRINSLKVKRNLALKRWRQKKFKDAMLKSIKAASYFGEGHFRRRYLTHRDDRRKLLARIENEIERLRTQIKAIRQRRVVINELFEVLGNRINELELRHANQIQAAAD